MKKLLPLLLLLPLLAIGCTSTGDAFLLKTLDPADKADALVTAGIDEYQVRIVHNEELDQIPRIREYFTTALGFDPTNARAQQYLTLVDNYKKEKLSTNVKAAAKIFAKPKRTDDDNYALYVSLQTAARLDPADTNVKKMLGDTAPDRTKLVGSYLTKAKGALSGVDDKTPDDVRVKQYTLAFQSVNMAVDVDPKNTDAQTQLTTVKAELAKAVARRVTTIQGLIAVGKFVDARTQVTALSDLNRKLDNSFATDVKAASYNLNYTWGKTLYDQKDYATAQVKVEAALTVKYTAEAAALRKQIAELQAKAAASVSFEVSLKEIDRLMGAGELLAAYRKLDTMDKATTDDAKQQMLDDRRGKIMDSLKDLYDRGVQAYRDEDFKTAIDLLQTVVGIKMDYEQAGDYLDKARQKQKLLDQL
jgi:tetratricopeptide (TPR) repeat protein